jgi:pSer/pThr/pTyr-binding forkhead associated (FHA) protein
LTNLLDGEPHGLSGNVVSIGRAGETPFPVESQITVEELVVSRLHLLVSKKWARAWAWDMRSLNGTTVNAQFLRYSWPVNLKQGDLIALAGVALFRFSDAKGSFIPFLQRSPPRPSTLAQGAWGILIDGATRTTTPPPE